MSSDKTAGRDYERAVESLLRAGYAVDKSVETYILVGLPRQNAENVRKSIEAVINLGGRPKVVEFSPIPGTPLFEEAMHRTPDIVKEPLLQNNTIYAPYVAKTVSPDELQNLKDITGLR